MDTLIIKEDDGFYYIDETANLIGPFKNAEQACVALDAYLHWVEQDNRHEVRKMRDSDD